jgi:hypothetical protein
MEDGWLEMRLTTCGVDAVKYLLYRWIPYVRVIKPDHLRKEMLKDLQIQVRELKTIV